LLPGSVEPDLNAQPHGRRLPWAEDLGLDQSGEVGVPAVSLESPWIFQAPPQAPPRVQSALRTQMSAPGCVSGHRSHVHLASESLSSSAPQFPHLQNTWAECPEKVSLGDSRAAEGLGPGCPAGEDMGVHDRIRRPSLSLELRASCITYDLRQQLGAWQMRWQQGTGDRMGVLSGPQPGKD
jgi:hypothetical protein